MAEQFIEDFRNRKRSRLVVEIDLDPVPGWGHDPEDHRALVERLLADAVPHYHPAVTVEELAAPPPAPG